MLGLVLGMAPVGGWLAVDPVLTLPALLFCAGVTAWVAGFDILYALQDESFDREHGLHSLPARYGAAAALRISSRCRASAALGFLLAGWSAGLAWPYFTVWAAAAGLLVWEGRLLAPGDLRRLSMAFFTLNGLVSVVLLAGALASLALE